jgi:hypothetical protein
MDIVKEAANVTIGQNSRVTATGHTDTAGLANITWRCPAPRQRDRWSPTAWRRPRSASSAGRDVASVQTKDGVRPQNRVEIVIDNVATGDGSYCNRLARPVRTNARGADPVGDRQCARQC